MLPPVLEGQRQRRSTAWMVALLLVCAVTSGGTARAGRSGSPARQPSVVVKVDRGGFRWGDAAIGAAAAFAVVLLVHGLALSRGRSKRHRVVTIPRGKEGR